MFPKTITATYKPNKRVSVILKPSRVTILLNSGEVATQFRLVL